MLWKFTCVYPNLMGLGGDGSLYAAPRNQKVRMWHSVSNEAVALSFDGVNNALKL